MADVVLGRAGDAVLIDLHVCAKSGRPTRDRVELRGSTMPSWVAILLLFTVVGFLLASAMTSRSYRVTLPLEHAIHDRWRRNRRRAWAAGLVGFGALVWAAASSERGAVGLGLVAGLVLVVGALVGGAVNARSNAVGFTVTRDGDLVLTRAHHDFARAVARATVEAAPARSDPTRRGSVSSGG